MMDVYMMNPQRTRARSAVFARLANSFSSRLALRLGVSTVAGVAALGLFISAARAQQATPDSSADGDTNLLSHTLSSKTAGEAWLEFQKSRHAPPLPAKWRDQPPSEAEQKAFIIPYLLAAADKARDYYTRFDKEVNDSTAKEQEYDLLALASQFGSTNLETRIDALEKNILSDSGLSQDDRFRVRQHSIERAAGKKQPEGSAAVMAELEKGVRQLQKEFPQRPEVMEMLMEVAANSSPEKAQAIVKEILASDAPPQVREMAESLGKKIEMVGKPLKIQFAAVDGRTVDLGAMKGKVVLVDFWATWCGPCVGELPHVKEAYDQLHAKGFEIVGISLDNSTEKLTAFTKEHGMAWPQFCDGAGWQNKYAQQFGVTSIPAMWLVDKNGNLRDMNGRDDLRGKIEKMLAE
jgi:peroxiredoxin